MTFHEKAPSPSLDGEIVTKAVLRAADYLGVKGEKLAKVLGLSTTTVSRMRAGNYVLQRGEKPFELAVLFVRLFRSLDAIIGGDEAVARAWLRNENTMLDGVPLENIQTVSGLVDAISYLDARRALV